MEVKEGLGRVELLESVKTFRQLHTHSPQL